MKMKNCKTKTKNQVSGNSNTDTKNHIWEKELKQSRIAKYYVESKHVSVS